MDANAITLTDDERLIIILSLEARAEKYAQLVKNFKGDKKYEKHYKASKAELDKTVDLLGRIKQEVKGEVSDNMAKGIGMPPEDFQRILENAPKVDLRDGNVEAEALKP